MNSKFLAVAIAVAALTCAGTAFAQPAPAANPLDAVPEKIPFDVPYGQPISMDRADAAVSAAFGEARAHGWKFVCTVVDSGANIVVSKRMDGAQLGSIDVAMHKARAAVKYRRETKAFEAGIQAGNVYLVTIDDVIGSRGGIPLLEGGRVIGAIGCSGGTGSQDEITARAGAATVK